MSGQAHIHECGLCLARWDRNRDQPLSPAGPRQTLRPGFPAIAGQSTSVLPRSLQGHGDEDGDNHDGGPQFAEVFVIVWVGAMIVTLNTKLLGH